MRRYHRIHLTVVGLYLLLTLFLTWPWAIHLTTHVPGEPTWAFDEFTFLWNMGWFKYSLLDLRQTPLTSGYIFFPLGIHLTTYTFNLFNAAFSLPLQLAFSLPLASNLTLIFSYVSGAYGMFLLSLYLLTQSPLKNNSPFILHHYLAGASRILGIRKKPPNPPPTPQSAPYGKLWADSYLAAFAAGVVYAFSASRMMYIALGHYNFVTIQWFPFYILFLLKVLRGTQWKNILLAGFFAALNLYTELTFSVFLIFITFILAIPNAYPLRTSYEMRGDYAKRSLIRGDILNFLSRHLFIRLIVLSLVAFLLTAPFTFSVLPDFLDQAYAKPGWGEGLKLSADLVGLVTPTPLSPLSGLDWRRELRAVIEGVGRFSDVNTLFLGYGILALAISGVLLRWKESRIWFWSILIFTILSLGPLLTINGQNRFDLDDLEVTFPLPFTLLHYLPIINANRVPNRFGIPLTLSLAALVGYAMFWVMGRVSHLLSSALRFTGYVLLLFLLLFDQYSVPLPLSDARIPEVYHQIGAELDDFTLMQLPLGWRNSYGTLGAEQTQLQYYQSAHHRPILGGNTSRNPTFKFDYYAHIPLFYALTETELYRPVDETTLQRARLQAAELMRLYNIKYLVIHEPIPQRKPYEDTYLPTRKLALDLIPHQPQPIYESPGVQAFAVQQAEIPNPLNLNFGDWRSDPYRGEGWADNEEIFAANANWVIASKAQIFFPAQGKGDRYLSLQIAPFSYPGMPEQQVSFSLNEAPLVDSFSLHEGWQTATITLPEVYLKDGLNRLTLHFSQTAQPRQVLPANRAIGKTGVETPVDLEVNSGSDFAFISVGFGEERVDASAHRQGINVAVVEPKSGRVTAVKGFDVAANPYESAALSRFIAEIPEGQIIIVASQGLKATSSGTPTGISFFDAETSTCLQSLGLAATPLAPPLAAIGVKGAPAGAALQASANGEGVAYLRLGLSPDTRSLAAAVDKVTITAP